MFKIENLVLLGYSGHAYVAIDVAASMKVKTIAYLDYRESDRNPYNLQYWGSEDSQSVKEDFSNCAVFSAVGDNAIRKKLVSKIEDNQWSQISLIDTSAKISDKAIIGLNTLISPKVVINSMAVVGKGCIINTSAIIEHDCEIGDFSHIAPGAILAGNVKIGESVFVGAGAVVKGGVSIEDNAIVGAGAVVLNNISKDETWVGNPAKRIK